MANSLVIFKSIQCFVFIMTFVGLTSAGDAWSYNQIETFCYREQYQRTVTRPGCKPESFLVHACLGNCRSYEKPLQDIPYFQTVCLCCKASTSVRKTFTLSDCKEGVDRTVEIESALTCNCEHTDKCKS